VFGNYVVSLRPALLLYYIGPRKIILRPVGKDWHKPFNVNCYSSVSLQKLGKSLLKLSTDGPFYILSPLFSVLLFVVAKEENKLIYKIKAVGERTKAV
jgi:hypothetical protein